MGIARSAGIPTVADMESDRDPLAGQFIQQVDHLVISRDFAFHFTKSHQIETALSRLWNANRSMVILTAGDEGCWWRSAGDEAVQYSPAFEVDAIDTTGCGDVFHGAYALAAARQMRPAERVEFASAAAALKATRQGGQSGAPSANELREFLRQRRG